MSEKSISDLVGQGFTDPVTHAECEFAEEAYRRLRGHEHYLRRFYEVGHARAAEEACESFGHDGRVKGMCMRCGADAASVRSEWLARTRPTQDVR